MAGDLRQTQYEQAVTLIINQGQVTNDWVKVHINVQTGIAVVAGAILGWRGTEGGWPVLVALVLLALLAIVMARRIGDIISRNLAWQRAFVDSIKLIEQTETYQIWRPDMLQHPGPRVDDTIRCLSTYLHWAWIVLVVGYGIIVICRLG